MNELYQHMVEDMINEAEDGIFTDDGLDDVVGVLSDGESDKVVLRDEDEDIDDEEEEDEDYE